MRLTFRKSSPRDFIRCLGVVIFLLMIVTAFIGYVLPWGQMNFWGDTVITSLASKLGSRIISFLLKKMGCSGLIAFVIWLVIAFVSGGAPFSEDLGMRNFLPSIEFSGDSWIEETYGKGEEASSSDVPTTSKNQNNEILELSQNDLWNNLEQPLLEEAKRKYQLSNKLLSSSLGYNPNIDFNQFNQDVQTHEMVEIVLEKALRVEGYLASDINKARNGIRELILYTQKDKAVKTHILEGYLSQMENDFRTSTPFKKLMKAKKYINPDKPSDLFDLPQPQ